MSYSFSNLDFVKPELGASFVGTGTHFAVFSAHAEQIELCLFSEDGKQELQRLALPHREGDIWSGYLEGVKPGTVYGYRAHGAYRPEEGLRFNPNKLLLDPYAMQLQGALTWDDALHGYTIGAENGDLSFDERDSAPFMLKGVVQDPDFDWDGDEAIRRPWTDTIIYEAHVRGLTMLNPHVPDALRGTFLGMCSDPILDHLQRLGITAIELLPVQSFIDDRYLVDKGLRNYWGYQPLGFFAPQPRFMSSERITEFKTMVRRFHEAGIEVIMDVVYNHTAEGSELGPTLSFRGLDNLSYYRPSPESPRYTFDTTGTGNTLNVAHPMVLRMVLDSLRYWVGTMHIDGFRFDLASTLGRENPDFDREGTFFNAIKQDPMLSGVKLIAEPWDIGHGGYQVGGFPTPFREWNDKYRDTVRCFWKKDEGQTADLAARLAGSSQQFNHSGRTASSSINLLSAHDGFTLADIVSYNEKHNEANGEDNQDGHSNNHSHNLGAEGPTDDADINAARVQRRRNMIATLMLSQGVPMLLGGDELGNTQYGNNNAYCQDNEIGWTHWDAADDAFIDFCHSIVEVRRNHPALRQDTFDTGEPNDDGLHDIAWFREDGQRMEDDDWKQNGRRFLSVYKSNIRDVENFDTSFDQVLIVINGGAETSFTLPTIDGVSEWSCIFDSNLSDRKNDGNHDKTIPIAADSLAVFVPWTGS
ncbi:glycogen debranching protein GlgX [Rhizobium sp. L1K21]|uniref:glycogen debranching protein GlgX n=1 Tax=Rhizobium sp. L1K21 TaxID=2954933 RepID=UPI0020938742|nr:glycogen debranching protein GlgX [Rhizobium sp. L1K21]MCO6187735.1 glycogen debranching protein GlgX [Rhizobium sp. L1K21]